MMYDEETIDRDTRPSDKCYAAYMCSLDASGEVWIGKCVRRWYETFTETRLCNKVMPYLEAKYIAKDWSYPFLITSYMLEDECIASYPVFADRKTRAKDIRFARRKRSRKPKGREKRVAIVLSPTEYKLLLP